MAKPSKRVPIGATENLEHRLRVRDRRMDEAHRIASSAARQDKSDPFTYKRIFSRIMNGIGEEYKFGNDGP